MCTVLFSGEKPIHTLYIMKHCLFFVFFHIMLISSAQDYRSSYWLESKDEVKKKETAILLEELSKPNYVDEIHYVQFDSGYASHIYYVFRKNQLIGVKTQKLRLSGQNTKFNALEAYKATFEHYEELYGKEKLRERNGQEQAIKILEIKLADRELFLTVERNGNEYYLIENHFRNSLYSSN